MSGAAVGAGGGPFGGAVGVVLVLPDGDAGFDLVDEVAVGIEGGFAVGGGGEGDDGGFADLEGADAVDGEGVGEGEFLEGFGDDLLAFLIGEDGVGLVVEAGDIPALVVIADEALEDDDGSAGGIGEVGAQGGEIEGAVLDGEHGRGGV